MAKFTTKNIEFRDWQKAIFGDSDDSYLMWDGLDNELKISTVVSGVMPQNYGHLATKFYADNLVGSILYEEVTKSGGRITQIVAWTNSSKTLKLSSTAINRSGRKVTSITKQLYDPNDGVSVYMTITETITRTNGKVTSVEFNR